MAAILDFKARTTPDEIPDDYYGMDVPALQDVETERQEGV
jgi:hypothetical protein